MHIESLLDMDFYKLTMGQFVFEHFPKVQIKYEFKSRASFHLSPFVNFSKLHAQLEHCRGLRFTPPEIAYLRSLGFFSENYLRFLENFQLLPYRLDSCDGNIILEFAGPWHQQIYWETIALSIVNGIYFDGQSVDYDYAIGSLKRKVDVLSGFPEIKFSDFGTRRRLSRSWHSRVIEEVRHLPGFIGSSNVYQSMLLNRPPVGTLAHELMMVSTALEIQHSKEDKWRKENLITATRDLLTNWETMYGSFRSIALTDTYGSDIFFDQIFAHVARTYAGVRQDSGDPFKFGYEAINFYDSHGIDPTEKTIVFSDGLELKTIVDLFHQFKGKVRPAFGWGTNLTNDTNIAPISIVIKPTEADGQPCVKLSDNIAKATGNRIAVENYKRFLGYAAKTHEACKY